MRQKPELICGVVVVVASVITQVLGPCAVNRVATGTFDVQLPKGYRFVSVTPDTVPDIGVGGWTSAVPGRVAFWKSNTAGTAADVGFAYIAARL